MTIQARGVVLFLQARETRVLHESRTICQRVLRPNRKKEMTCVVQSDLKRFKMVTIGRDRVKCVIGFSYGLVITREYPQPSQMIFFRSQVVER